MENKNRSSDMLFTGMAFFIEYDAEEYNGYEIPNHVSVIDEDMIRNWNINCVSFMKKIEKNKDDKFDCRVWRSTVDVYVKQIEKTLSIIQDTKKKICSYAFDESDSQKYDLENHPTKNRTSFNEFFCNNAGDLLEQYLHVISIRNALEANFSIASQAILKRTFMQTFRQNIVDFIINNLPNKISDSSRSIFRSLDGKNVNNKLEHIILVDSAWKIHKKCILTGEKFSYEKFWSEGDHSIKRLSAMQKDVDILNEMIEESVKDINNKSDLSLDAPIIKVIDVQQIIFDSAKRVLALKDTKSDKEITKDMVLQAMDSDLVSGSDNVWNQDSVFYFTKEELSDLPIEDKLHVAMIVPMILIYRHTKLRQAYEHGMRSPIMLIKDAVVPTYCAMNNLVSADLDMVSLGESLNFSQYFDWEKADCVGNYEKEGGFLGTINVSGCISTATIRCNYVFDKIGYFKEECRGVQYCELDSTPSWKGYRFCRENKGISFACVQTNYSSRNSFMELLNAEKKVIDVDLSNKRFENNSIYYTNISIAIYKFADIIPLVNGMILKQTYTSSIDFELPIGKCTLGDIESPISGIRSTILEKWNLISNKFCLPEFYTDFFVNPHLITVFQNVEIPKGKLDPISNNGLIYDTVIQYITDNMKHMYEKVNLDIISGYGLIFLEEYDVLQPSSIRNYNTFAMQIYEYELQYSIFTNHILYNVVNDKKELSNLDKPSLAICEQLKPVKHVMDSFNLQKILDMVDNEDIISMALANSRKMVENVYSDYCNKSVIAVEVQKAMLNTFKFHPDDELFSNNRDVIMTSVFLKNFLSPVKSHMTLHEWILEELIIGKNLPLTKEDKKDKKSEVEKVSN